MQRGWRGRALLVGGLVAVAPAVWWSLGLLPDDVSERSADFLVRPPAWSPGVTSSIGVVSVTLVAFAVSGVVRGFRSGAVDRRRLGIILTFASVSAFAGLTWAVVTAPVIGANIGGGMLLLAAPFVAVSAAVVVMLLARDLRRHAVPGARDVR